MVKETMDLIGQEGLYTVGEDFSVRVVILNIRSVYGRLQLKVQPKLGTGSKWVDQAKVFLHPPPQGG